MQEYLVRKFGRLNAVNVFFDTTLTLKRRAYFSYHYINIIARLIHRECRRLGNNLGKQMNRVHLFGIKG